MFIDRDTDFSKQARTRLRSIKPVIHANIDNEKASLLHHVYLMMVCTERLWCVRGAMIRDNHHSPFVAKFSIGICYVCPPTSLLKTSA